MSGKNLSHFNDISLQWDFGVDLDEMALPKEMSPCKLY